MKESGPVEVHTLTIAEVSAHDLAGMRHKLVTLDDERRALSSQIVGGGTPTPGKRLTSDHQVREGPGCRPAPLRSRSQQRPDLLL